MIAKRCIIFEKKKEERLIILNIANNILVSFFWYLSHLLNNNQFWFTKNAKTNDGYDFHKKKNNCILIQRNKILSSFVLIL